MIGLYFTFGFLEELPRAKELQMAGFSSDPLEIGLFFSCKKLKIA
jgi:hypothetical protein